MGSIHILKIRLNTKKQEKDYKIVNQRLEVDKEKSHTRKHWSRPYKSITR